MPVVRDRAGRPEHVWTLENSHKINLLFATGHGPKDAAAALGITMPTFRKHYFSELEQWRVAKLKLKAKHLLTLDAQASAGSVPAAKELFKQIDKGNLAALAEAVKDRRSASPRATPKLGKKAERKEAAVQVKGKFAPPEGPTLLN